MAVQRHAATFSDGRQFLFPGLQFSEFTKLPADYAKGQFDFGKLNESERLVSTPNFVSQPLTILPIFHLHDNKKFWIKVRLLGVVSHHHIHTL